MYLGKVEISNSWTKLEDLIKAQVEGQSEFAFDADTKYQIQGEGEFSCRLCDFTTAPTNNYDGVRLYNTQTAVYKKSTSGYLYVRTESDLSSKGYVKIDIMGD